MEVGEEGDDIPISTLVSRGAWPYIGPWRGGGGGEMAIAGPSRACAEGEGVGGGGRRERRRAGGGCQSNPGVSDSKPVAKRLLTVGLNKHLFETK